jgi:hypothetical protein
MLSYHLLDHSIYCLPRVPNILDWTLCGGDAFMLRTLKLTFFTNVISWVKPEIPSNLNMSVPSSRRRREEEVDE